MGSDCIGGGCHPHAYKEETLESQGQRVAKHRKYDQLIVSLQFPVLGWPAPNADTHFETARRTRDGEKIKFNRKPHYLCDRFNMNSVAQRQRQRSI